MTDSPPAPSSPAGPRRDTPGAGCTQSDRGDEGPSPRLPHERDESADSQTPGRTDPSQADVGERARRDLEEGRQDTDRAPLTDQVYRGLKTRRGR